MSDPFRTLGLPATFDLGGDQVESAFLTRAAAVHPDLDPESPESLRLAADLNHARATLADPETRADALLGLLGGPTSKADPSLPPGFLMEVMELRESIDDAAASGDAEALAGLTKDATDRRHAMIAQVAEMFRDLPPSPGPERHRALATIRTQLNAWRYLERMLEALRGLPPPL